MSARIERKGGLALAVQLRRKLMPENSIRNDFYCRFIQPLIRVGVDVGALFAKEVKTDKNKSGGIATVASPQLQNRVDDIKRILIVKLDHIGDFVLGFPAHRALREAFPNAQITLLCGTWNKSLAEQSGLFDRVVCQNLFYEASGHCKGGINFDKAAFDALSLKDFDIAIDFRDSGETRFLLDLVSAKFKAGFAAAGQESHMDLAFPSTSFRLKAAHRTHHQTVQSLLAASVISSVTDARSMNAVLNRIVEPHETDECHALGQGPLIGINIGSGDIAKNWPLDRFITLGRCLVRDLDATIILLGSKMQEEDSRCMAQGLPKDRVINRVGLLSIPQCMGVMRKLDLYIGNDTGTTHIAAGLDVPTICLFSVLTTHESHGAIGSRCLSILADRNQGIESIRCHHVMRAATEILNGNAKPKKSSEGWMNFIVIDNKPYNSDFRKYLLRAAAQDHANTIHIECSSEIKVTFNDEVIDRYDHDENSIHIASVIKDFLGQRETLILVGLGLSSQPLRLVRSLKKAFQKSTALYDVFDYFRYDAKGSKLVVQAMLDLATRRICDRSIVLDRGLKWLYPRAAHLDNASHLSRSLLLGMSRPDRLVYIGSIDCRVDFEWLDALMALGASLDIYGKVHKGDIQIGRELEAFLERNKNAAFYGAYDNDDLPAILEKYQIGLVPYYVNNVMTDHINPDKVYHYLNAGLEVIATPIPQCKRMRNYLHLTPGKQDISKALDAAKNRPRNASWPVNKYTWEQRWWDILAIAGIDRLMNKAL